MCAFKSPDQSQGGCLHSLAVNIHLGCYFVPTSFGAQVMLGYVSHVRAMKFNTTSKLKAGWARTDPRLPDVMAAKGHKYAVLFCYSRRDLKALQDHPVTAALVAHSKRVSICIRVSGYLHSTVVCTNVCGGHDSSGDGASHCTHNLVLQSKASFAANTPLLAPPTPTPPLCPFCLYPGCVIHVVSAKVAASDAVQQRVKQLPGPLSLLFPFS